MEAGKRRLAGDTARSANTDEVRDLRREARDLKEVVAEQTLDRLGIARPTFYRWYDLYSGLARMRWKTGAQVPSVLGAEYRRR